MSHKCNSSHSIMPDGTWIGWFVNLQVNAFLCRVPFEFVQDRFNLTGLEMLVPSFHQTLDAILDTEFDTDYGFNPMDTDPELTAQLYGLIHARYIITARGIDDMCQKYQRGEFGICPRIFATGCLSATCALCSARWGNVWQQFSAHVFMQLPQLLPEPPVEKYTPRIYGFQLHKSALSAPKSQSSGSNSPNNKNSPGQSKVSHCANVSLEVSPTSRPPMRRFNFTLN